MSKRKSKFLQFLDVIDVVDRQLHGNRVRLFIWLSFMVVLIGPLLDWLFIILIDHFPEHFFRLISSSTFLAFNIFLVLSFINSWRVDGGKLSLKRAKSKSITYCQVVKDNIKGLTNSSSQDLVYDTGQSLIIISICLKAIQYLGEFIYQPIDAIPYVSTFNIASFEALMNQLFWLFFLSGIICLAYLYKNNYKILFKLKAKLLYVLLWQNHYRKYFHQPIKITTSTNNLVINTKSAKDIQQVISNSESNLFIEFIKSLEKWEPRIAYYEYEFQDQLYRHLNNYLSNAHIEAEYPIGKKKARADLVINDSLLIEMKNDSSAGAIQRAKGQILEYSEVWKGRGPIILLLCEYDYERARNEFEKTMENLNNSKIPAMTIVA